MRIMPVNGCESVEIKKYNLDIKKCGQCSTLERDRTGQCPGLSRLA
jgi:hypothetical protein